MTHMRVQLLVCCRAPSHLGKIAVTLMNTDNNPWAVFLETLLGCGMGSDLLDQFLFYTFRSCAISQAPSLQTDVPKLTGRHWDLTLQLQDTNKEQQNNITA